MNLDSEENYYWKEHCSQVGASIDAQDQPIYYTIKSYSYFKFHAVIITPANSIRKRNQEVLSCIFQEKKESNKTDKHSEKQ